MSAVAVIGGSGLYALEGFLPLTAPVVTPYGEVSGLLIDECGNYFLPRHGTGHKLPPHKINYRANIWALKSLGVGSIVAVNAVGGIHPQMGPGKIVVADQIIDYSYGREHTYCDATQDGVNHIDFTEPLSASLRARLLAECRRTLAEGEFCEVATYGCVQGPRLETAAEIQRLKRDGCDLVGMTMMPEAALARELAVDYASFCVVANWAAGIESQPISMEQIWATLNGALGRVKTLIAGVISHID